MTDIDLDALGEVRVGLTVLVGRATASIGEVLSYVPGTVVPLDVQADAPVELFVNGIAIASGELVATQEGSLAVQITELVRPSQEPDPS